MIEIEMNLKKVIDHHHSVQYFLLKATLIIEDNSNPKPLVNIVDLKNKLYNSGQRELPSSFLLKVGINTTLTDGT